MRTNVQLLWLMLGSFLCFNQRGDALAQGIKEPGGGGEDKRPVVVPQPNIVLGPSFGGAGGTVHTQNCRHPYGIQMDVTVGGIRRLGLRCTDDTETAFWDLPVAGPPGLAMTSLECQPGYEIAGIQGRSGSYVDAIGLFCRPIDLSKRILQDRTPVYGGAGGSDFRWECPRSFHIEQVQIGSGVMIDSIQIICAHD